MARILAGEAHPLKVIRVLNIPIAVFLEHCGDELSPKKTRQPPGFFVRHSIAVSDGKL